MTKFIGFLFLFQILFYSCNKNESIRPLVSPSFSTNVPIEVTPTSVTLSATIKTIGSKSIADHGLYCDDHGFYWSENKGVNAKTGTIISLGPALVTGSFEAKIFNLKRGTLYYAVAFVNIGGTTFLGNEISFSTTSHTITSVSPSSATVGTSVVISGTNFVTDPSKITLSVGGVPVSVSSSTETEITFLVPTNFSAGKKNLSIKIDALEKLLVDGFTVIPSITSISPLRSLSLQTITIQGNGFSSISSEIAVSFDAVSASVLSSSVKILKRKPKQTG